MKNKNFLFLCLSLVFFVFASGGCGGNSSDDSYRSALPNSEEQPTQIEKEGVKLDASKFKITLSDPPKETNEVDIAKLADVQITQNPLSKIETFTLDEIVTQHNREGKETGSKELYSTKFLSVSLKLDQENARSGDQYVLQPLTATDSLRTAPGLSMENAYSFKNKKIQARMTAQNQIHWYKVVVDASENGREFSFILTDIPQGCNYDMYISTNGTDFSGLPQAGNAMEQWALQLPAGTYYLIVFANVQLANPTSDYTLYAGRRYWSKMLNIEIPHEAWDVNGRLIDFNPMHLGAYLEGNQWYLRTKNGFTYNLDALPYSVIPYGALVHHHNGSGSEYGSRFLDRSYLRSLSDWNWGTLQDQGAYHFTKPTNAAYASAMSGRYRYSKDTLVDDGSANLINRSVKFPVRQNYLVEIGFDSPRMFLWETFYYIETLQVWIEFEANSMNIAHLNGDGAGISCQGK